VEVAVAARIGFQLVRIWDGDRTLERELIKPPQTLRRGRALYAGPSGAATADQPSPPLHEAALHLASYVLTPCWSMQADGVLVADRWVKPPGRWQAAGRLARLDPWRRRAAGPPADRRAVPARDLVPAELCTLRARRGPGQAPRRAGPLP
jgi:hypothetical protein